MTTTTAVPCVTEGGHLGVSRTSLKTSTHDLKNSEWLDLLYTATSDASRDLATALLPGIEAGEQRDRPRGPKERLKAQAALEAVLGGVLVPSITKQRLVHRSMAKASFEQPIGYQAAKLVLDSMVREGLLVRYPGIQYLSALDGQPAGMVTRFEATDALIGLAETHGIRAETVSLDFTRNYPQLPPKVAALLTLRTFEARNGRKAARGGGGAGVALPVRRSDAVARGLTRQVNSANAALKRGRWENCQPPRLYRAFREDWTYGGRWVTAGSAAVQTMSPAARLLIRVNGGPVAECDATASQLTILAGLAGVARLADDPYALLGYGREIVKLAVAATLGNGRMPTRWPRNMLADHPGLEEVALKPLVSALANAYPYLCDPARVLGVARDHVSLRLQAIEAEILTVAMVPLWREGIPVIPIHDGILCPAGCLERVSESMVTAYRDSVAMASVRVKVARAL